MAAETIYYEHRNSHLYVVQVEKTSVQDVNYYKVIKSEIYKKSKALDKKAEGSDSNIEIIDYRDYDNYFSYKRNKQVKKHGILMLELSQKEESVPSPDKGTPCTSDQIGQKILVDAESFYTEVELKKDGKPNYIEISSVADYIVVIDMYKVVSLFVKCEALLTRYIRKLEKRVLPNQESKEAQKQDFIEDLSSIREKAISSKDSILDLIHRYSEDKSMSKDVYNAELDKAIAGFIKELDDKDINSKREYKATTDLSDIIRIMGDACRSITHSLRLYRTGDYAMYYRGVGRIVFPELPGVFRGNLKYEEDRQYKAMIMAFPNEFSGLHYLDRVAKLQHFGLPTRLLDVSSNPLVALYMACNKIYTGDPEQEDWGEIILYFMAGEKDRAYDSKSVLINAALVKLSHNEKTILFQFLSIHDVYIKKLGINKPKLLKDILNDCIHLAHDYGVNAILPDYESATLKSKIHDVTDDQISVTIALKKADEKKNHQLEKDLTKLRSSLTAIRNRKTGEYAKSEQKSKDIAKIKKQIAQKENSILLCKESIEQLKDTLVHLEATKREVSPDNNTRKTACDLCWICMQKVAWPINGRNWRSVDEDNYANYREMMNESDYRHLFRDVVRAYTTLLGTIRRENPAFENRIDLFALAKSVHGNIGMTNDRILAQSGSFIISGVDNYYINNHMLSTRSENYSRMIIKNKKAIIHELQLLNITDATMLPDLSHKADYIKGQINNSDILPIKAQILKLQND